MIVPSTIDGLPVTRIGDGAFSGSGVTSVAIPESVTSIGERAFSTCSRLAAITVDALNSFYSSVDGVLFNKTQTLLVRYPESKTGSNYAIPAGVTTIWDEAFSACIGLTSVTIPNSVTSISVAAFYQCTSLSSVTVPNSVTSIGNYAFSFCTRLTSVTIPNSITTIEVAAFKSSGLTNITIPNSVTSIGSCAFCDTSLNSVTIPGSVTNIGDYAFASCNSLSSVTIGNSVTSIGRHAFRNCTSLTSVTIPKSVTSIGDEAFSSCNTLAGVYFQGNVPTIGFDVFIGANSVNVYYLPGTTGWGTTFAERPALLWDPQVQTSHASFGVHTNQFGFAITGISSLLVVVEACTNLVNPAWTPVATATLTGGSSYFGDPQWTNYPARFYRLRSP